MTETQGRTAATLRVVVLLLLAATCYQIGYDSGYANGNWQVRQQQMWEAVHHSAVDDGDTDAATTDAAAAAGLDMSDLDPEPLKGYVLCPPAVLGRPRPSAPDQVAQAPRIPATSTPAAPNHVAQVPPTPTPLVAASILRPGS